MFADAVANPRTVTGQRVVDRLRDYFGPTSIFLPLVTALREIPQHLSITPATLIRKPGNHALNIAKCLVYRRS